MPAALSRERISEGRPHPLGATWDGLGVNFALFSAFAEKVELCLFDAAGEREIFRVELPEYTDEVFHGYLPDARPGTVYAFRVLWSVRAGKGPPVQPSQAAAGPVCQGACRQAGLAPGAVRLHRSVLPMRQPASTRAIRAQFMPKMPCDRPGLHLGPRYARRWCPGERTIIYEAHVRGFTKLHAGHTGAAARHLRPGWGSPTSWPTSSHSAWTSVELLPVQTFVNDERLLQQGLTNYWGYNTIGFFAPRSALCL